MSISAIIFDGDGVLFDSEEITNLCFRQLMESRGVVLSRRDTEAFIGIGPQQLLPIIRERHGVDFEPADYARIRDEMYEKACRHTGILLPMPGVIPLLDWLTSQPIPFALATGASRWKMQFNLEHTGLARYFEVAVCADDVTRNKPAPDIYIEAAHRLAIDIQTALIVEDSIPGLQGARAAGARPIGLAGTHPVYELGPYADFVAPNHARLLEYLRNLNLKRPQKA